MKPVLQEILKGILKQKQKLTNSNQFHNQKYENYKIKNLSKGKYRAKVEN